MKAKFINESLFKSKEKNEIDKLIPKKFKDIIFLAMKQRIPFFDLNNTTRNIPEIINLYQKAKINYNFRIANPGLQYTSLKNKKEYAEFYFRFTNYDKSIGNVKKIVRQYKGYDYAILLNNNTVPDYLNKIYNWKDLTDLLKIKLEEELKKKRFK